MAFDRAQAIFALTTGMVSEEERELIVRKLETDEIAEVSAAVGAKVMFTKLVDPVEPPADDPAFLQHCDEVWKARRDESVKEFITALREETAEIADVATERHKPGRKESSMFKTEVAKARTGGLSRTEAMAAARKADPKAFESYRRRPISTTTKVDGLPRRLIKTGDQLSFDAKVTEIAKRDGISITDAVVKARTAHPQLFRRAYPRR
jgi:hypothetical protein